MKIRTPVVAMLVVTMLGCASAGNQALKEQTKETVSQKITKGLTTKDQVRKEYGDPMDTSFTEGGSEIWKYRYAHAETTAMGYVPIVRHFAGGTDVDKKELVILFDKNGVVENFTMQQSKQQIRHGTSE
jgi:outer membrane protein assembly factor BamE (lipoprotein component of BamABCDE complex)